jgi:hypothetical protein
MITRSEPSPRTTAPVKKPYLIPRCLGEPNRSMSAGAIQVRSRPLCCLSNASKSSSRRRKLVVRSRARASARSTMPRRAARSRMPSVPVTSNPFDRASATPRRSSMRRRSAGRDRARAIADFSPSSNVAKAGSSLARTVDTSSHPGNRSHPVFEPRQARRCGATRRIRLRG